MDRLTTGLFIDFAPRLDVCAIKLAIAPFLLCRIEPPPGLAAAEPRAIFGRSPCGVGTPPCLARAPQIEDFTHRPTVNWLHSLSTRGSAPRAGNHTYGARYRNQPPNTSGKP